MGAAVVRPQPGDERLAPERRAEKVRVDHPPPLGGLEQAHLAGGADTRRVDDEIE
jgi:hypothetical protein